jgi:hypothetical protein
LQLHGFTPDGGIAALVAEVTGSGFIFDNKHIARNAVAVSINAAERARDRARPQCWRCDGGRGTPAARSVDSDKVTGGQQVTAPGPSSGSFHLRFL